MKVILFILAILAGFNALNHTKPLFLKNQDFLGQILAPPKGKIWFYFILNAAICVILLLIAKSM